MIMDSSSSSHDEVRKQMAAYVKIGIATAVIRLKKRYNKTTEEMVSQLREALRQRTGNRRDETSRPQSPCFPSQEQQHSACTVIDVTRDMESDGNPGLNDFSSKSGLVITSGLHGLRRIVESSLNKSAAGKRRAFSQRRTISDCTMQDFSSYAIVVLKHLEGLLDVGGKINHMTPSVEAEILSHLGLVVKAYECMPPSLDAHPEKFIGALRGFLNRCFDAVIESFADLTCNENKHLCRDRWLKAVQTFSVSSRLSFVVLEEALGQLEPILGDITADVESGILSYRTSYRLQGSYHLFDAVEQALGTLVDPGTPDSVRRSAAGNCAKWWNEMIPLTFSLDSSWPLITCRLWPLLNLLHCVARAEVKDHDENPMGSELDETCESSTEDLEAGYESF